MVDGVQKISGLDGLKFRYYKSFSSNEATMENLETRIPNSAVDYKRNREEVKLENYKHFLNKSYLDPTELVENTLTLKKIYADPSILNI